jgi:hypothetical protein
MDGCRYVNNKSKVLELPEARGVVNLDGEVHRAPLEGEQETPSAATSHGNTCACVDVYFQVLPCVTTAVDILPGLATLIVPKGLALPLRDPSEVPPQGLHLPPASAAAHARPAAAAAAATPSPPPPILRQDV